MHLKEFSFVSPAVQGGEVLKAIEAAIPPEAIDRALALSQAQECRTRSLPAPPRGLFSNCDELMVCGLSERRTQELG